MFFHRCPPDLLRHESPFIVSRENVFTTEFTIRSKHFGVCTRSLPAIQLNHRAIGKNTTRSKFTHAVVFFSTAWVLIGFGPLVADRLGVYVTFSGLSSRPSLFRFLTVFSLRTFLRENRSSGNVWENAWRVPDVLLPDIRGLLSNTKFTARSKFTMGSCGPGKLTEKGKFPKVLRGGCKRSFGPREQRSPKSLLHHPKLLLHRCKMGFGWCKRLFGDLCSLGPKDLLHPPLSTFGNFPFSVNFPGPQLPWL